MIGVARLATPPACQIHDRMMTPLLAHELREALADRRRFPGGALRVGWDEPGHQADVELRELAARVRDRVEAQIKRALSQRRELRHGLHQRGVRIDLRHYGAVSTLLELGREPAAQPVAEVALVYGSARELVRDFELLGLGAGGAADPRCGESGRR